MAVSKRTRYEVLRRDNFTCRYCRSSEEQLTVDHVTPVSLGGSDSPDKRVAACKDCNAGKSSSNPDATLVEDVKQDAVRWASAMNTATTIRARQRAACNRYVASAENEWDAWYCGGPEKQLPMPRPADWRSTFGTFYEHGLPIEELIEAIDIACGNGMVTADRTWKYMCGVAWRKVASLHDLARQQPQWAKP